MLSFDPSTCDYALHIIVCIRGLLHSDGNTVAVLLDAEVLATLRVSLTPRTKSAVFE